MPHVLQQAAELVKQAWIAWNAHNAPRIGAALAYYTVFSMAPILLIAIAVAGLVFGEDAARHEVSAQMEGMLGATGAVAVEEMINNANRGGGGAMATLLGTLALLAGATSVFAELQSALNLIWDAPPSKRKKLGTLLHARFVSFAMVLVIGFLLLVSLVISAALSGFQGALGAVSSSPLIAQSINVVVSVLVTTTLFALIYKVLPDVEVAWRDVAVGALATALLFSLGKLLIGVYLGNSSLASTYGAAGSFAVMLVWVYYSAQLILFGAEFTQVYARLHGTRIGEPLAVDAQAAAKGGPSVRSSTAEPGSPGR